MENEGIMLEESIRDLIFDCLNIDYMPKEDVDYDAPIFESFDEEGIGMGVDSVDALELAVALKKEYGLEISDEGMGIFKSIRTIADKIRTL